MPQPVLYLNFYTNARKVTNFLSFGKQNLSEPRLFTTIHVFFLPYKILFLMTCLRLPVLFL